MPGLFVEPAREQSSFLLLAHKPNLSTASMDQTKQDEKGRRCSFVKCFLKGIYDRWALINNIMNCLTVKQKAGAGRLGRVRLPAASLICISSLFESCCAGASRQQVTGCCVAGSFLFLFFAEFVLRSVHSSADSAHVMCVSPLRCPVLHPPSPARSPWCVWWCETMHHDETLYMMMWHYVWWCAAMYAGHELRQVRMMMWHYVWWRLS